MMLADTTKPTLIARIAVRCGVARVVRFHRDESGATAVEFGIVAVPFFALMFAIFEVGLTFFAGQLMETAVDNAGRLIRTGQAQQDGLTLGTFKDKICAQTYQILDCQNGLKLDVRKFSTFDSMTLTPPLDQDGNLITDNFIFQPGSGGEIVLVRAYYEWPVFLNAFGTGLQNMPSGKHLLSAAAAFKNEPFPW